MMKKGKKKKSNVLKNIVPMMIGAALGIVVFIGLETIESSGNDYGEMNPIVVGIVAMISTLISIVLHIIIHEGGHLICGLLSGYKFSSFRVFNLMVKKEDSKLIFKNYTLPGTGGQCLMEPPKIYDTNIPYKLYNFGGVLFNLIFSAITLIATLVFVRDFYVTTGLLVFCLIGIVLGLSNAIPMKMGGLPNDGKNIMYIGKSKESHYALWVQLKYATAQANNVRIQDMPVEWFEYPKKVENELDITLLLFIAERHIAFSEFEKAKEIHEKVCELCKDGSLFKTNALMELMFFSIIEGKSKEEVDEFFTDEVKAYFKAANCIPTTHRIMLAYSLLTNDEKQAEESLMKFNKSITTFPYLGVVEVENALVNLIPQKPKVA